MIIRLRNTAIAVLTMFSTTSLVAQESIPSYPPTDQREIVLWEDKVEMSSGYIGVAQPKMEITKPGIQIRYSGMGSGLSVGSMMTLLRDMDSGWITLSDSRDIPTNQNQWPEDYDPSDSSNRPLYYEFGNYIVNLPREKYFPNYGYEFRNYLFRTTRFYNANTDQSFEVEQRWERRTWRVPSGQSLNYSVGTLTFVEISEPIVVAFQCPGLMNPTSTQQLFNFPKEHLVSAKISEASCVLWNPFWEYQ